MVAPLQENISTRKIVDRLVLRHCLPSLGEGHPENEDELEGVVEWEPVDGVDGALEDGQESESDPVSQPLLRVSVKTGQATTRSLLSVRCTYVGVIGLARGEQSLERVVSWDDETSQVDEELSGNVEEDQEEVEGAETQDGVDLGNGALLLKVFEGRVLGQLWWKR